MGGCWANSTKEQKKNSQLIDSGFGLGEAEASWPEDTDSRVSQQVKIALSRVIKHRERIIAINPLGTTKLDQPLRAALTNMLLKTPCKPEPGSAVGLRYLKDRISVPRDMPLLAARILRKALESTAEIDSCEQGPMIPTQHRLDQNPNPFQKK